MELTEIHTHLTDNCDFPVDRAGLIAAVGDREVTAADGGSTRLADALQATDEPQYGSATEAHEAILANLGDAHVGRKFYDDRGGTGQDRHRTRSL
ncbi:DUF5789 family protein [Halococcoides cellulosivorans]|uniref:DUF2795 domain-containing protein n=1 Tax=Halococcoides cellulosivorans TaxID=1679096 RepID=A0A2R4WXU7_9EURY|nr:hypothetical protein [Halococcoides cellulosivorans]AWB26365.1 hypothetical protein HARCEL1_00840 [Halococcoides cellulosivorans]